jgi:hypothetical protein
MRFCAGWCLPIRKTGHIMNWSRADSSRSEWPQERPAVILSGELLPGRTPRRPLSWVGRVPLEDGLGHRIKWPCPENVDDRVLRGSLWKTASLWKMNCAWSATLSLHSLTRKEDRNSARR